MTTADKTTKPSVLADVSPRYWKNGERNPKADSEEKLNYCLVDIDAWWDAVVDDDPKNPVVKFLQDVIEEMNEWSETRGLWSSDSSCPYYSNLEMQRLIAEQLYALHCANVPLMLPDFHDEELIRPYYVKISDPDDGMRGPIWYTYNWENALSSDIHGLTFEIDDEHYIVSSEHIGRADARSGFDSLKAGHIEDYDQFLMSQTIEYSIVDRRAMVQHETLPGMEGDAPREKWIEGSLSTIYEWLDENGLDLVFPEWEPTEEEKYRPRFDAHTITVNHSDVEFYVRDHLEW